MSQLLLYHNYYSAKTNVEWFNIIYILMYILIVECGKQNTKGMLEAACSQSIARLIDSFVERYQLFRLFLLSPVPSENKTKDTKLGLLKLVRPIT